MYDRFWCNKTEIVIFKDGNYYLPKSIIMEEIV